MSQSLKVCSSTAVYFMAVCIGAGAGFSAVAIPQLKKEGLFGDDFSWFGNYIGS